MSGGLKNLLTDVAGLKVGNAADDDLRSGVTAVICEEPFVASADVAGGAPGTRDIAHLSPEQTVEGIDAIVLSGGSAFGLDAAGGVMTRLVDAGRGFDIRGTRVPIVSSAILFDLPPDANDVERGPIYRELGKRAFDQATTDFELGTAGAGTGATTATLKGGLGSASTRLSSGHVVAALVAANPVGQVTIGETGYFWAAPFEQDDEFGGLGWPSPLPPSARDLRHKLQPTTGANTTIAVVATDAPLGKGQAKRLAVMAHDGAARAMWPAHTAFDGDIVFAIATGRGPHDYDVIELGAAAADCMARATARGVFLATPAEGDPLPAWRDRFG